MTQERYKLRFIRRETIVCEFYSTFIPRVGEEVAGLLQAEADDTSTVRRVIYYFDSLSNVETIEVHISSAS